MRAEIVQVVKHSPRRFTCVMKFLERVHIDALVASEPFLVASVSPLASSSSAGADALIQTTTKVRDYLAAVVADAQAKEAQATAQSREREREKDKDAAPPKGELTRAQVQAIVDPDKLVDVAVPYLELDRDDLTALLVETDTMKRLERIIPHRSGARRPCCGSRPISAPSSKARRAAPIASACCAIACARFKKSSASKTTTPRSTIYARRSKTAR